MSRCLAMLSIIHAALLCMTYLIIFFFDSGSFEKKREIITGFAVRVNTCKRVAMDYYDWDRYG